MSAAVIQGDYVDLRFVKGRKVCQFVIELPIEMGPRIVDAFGTPNPETTIPVAVARLKEGAKPEEKERKSFNELKPSQQAGILCGQADFWTFLKEHYHTAANNEDEAAIKVRGLCGVRSRAELNVTPVAADHWQQIRSEFEAWKRM